MRIALALAFLPCTLAFVQPAAARSGALPSHVGQPVCTAAAAARAEPDEERVPRSVSAGDWSGIRAAHEVWKRAVIATPTGYGARNSGQQWRSSFDGRGFTLEPDAGGWTWGLALERWGFAGALREVDGLAAGCAEGERVEYGWDAALTEWYVNGAGGLEHGYTVSRRPEGGGERLTFELAVRGGLAPRIDADGRGARFVDEAGVAIVTYRGLEVLDALGRELEARLVGAAGGLSIEIDEHGACYPLTIDPIAQQAYLKASNTEAGDYFGHSVSVSGDIAVIGAIWEDSSSTGVGGDQTNNGAFNSGAAYVFVRSGTTWSQQAYLKASNTGSEDHFGWSVSVSGDTAVVGAHYEDSSATGVDGNQADNSAISSGAAYVFVRSGTTWSQQAYLKASNTEALDLFGYSVSVSGDTAVVGAYYEDSSATGIGGDQTSNGATNSGAAYVFVRSGTTWSQQAYLKASNTGTEDYFGHSVSISGDMAAIGAYYEDSSATGVNGDQTNNNAFDSGAAYVFVRSETTWSQQAYLKASNTETFDWFGRSVSVSGDTAVVGAYLEDSSATGVNGNQADNIAVNSGAVFVFVRSGATWSQQAYLKASNTEAFDYFGGSVSVSGDTVLVGAIYESSSATGVDGDQLSNGAFGSGAAYVFVRNGTTWSQQAYLKASNTEAYDRFGWSVSVSGDTAVVGANFEDSSATGVNGDQTSNSAADSGAAYVFLLPPVAPPPVAYCFGDGTGTPCPCGNASASGANEGCLNSLGTGGRLVSVGTARLSADTLVLHGSGMTNSSARYFQGTARLNGGLGVVFGDGLSCAGGTSVSLGTKTNVAGASQYPDTGDLSVSVRGLVTVPGTRDYQVWYRNAAAFCTAATFNLSNGWEVVWVL